MRPINKIIIHCSATPEGRHVGIDEIDCWHRAAGFRRIGYHFVIYLDGTVVSGRPIEEVGAHCRGQNSDSIGICYVGGTDSYGNPRDTRTTHQRRALIELVKSLKSRFPDARIYGHNDFAAKACPSFNVHKDKDL